MASGSLIQSVHSGFRILGIGLIKSDMAKRLLTSQAQLKTPLWGAVMVVQDHKDV